MHRPNRPLAVLLLLAWSASAVAQPSPLRARDAADEAGPGPGDPEPLAEPTPNAGPDGEGELALGVSAALERARSYYQSGSYDACVESYEELFGQLDNPVEQVPPKALEQARVHFAACLLAQGRESDADRQLRIAMQENPLMASPDPVVFPAQVRDLFFKVKADFLELIRKTQADQLRAAREEERKRQEEALAERRRVQRLEQLAAQEQLVHHNDRWMAAVPFGVGQFQNGDDALGGVFLVSELLLLAATVTGAAVQLGIHAAAEGGKKVIDPDNVNGPLLTAHRVAVFSGAGLILIGGLGILEAQVNFVEERPLGTRSRPDPLKPTLSVRPEVSHVEGGAVFGVGGKF